MQEKFMKQAIREAQKAAAIDEVPVGAVIVREGKIIARGHNLRESKHDPTAHAEMIAIRKAAKKLGGWRLTGCELYVTLEPCPMCAGAAVQSRLSGIVFGAYDPKGGCCGTICNLAEEPRFNHRLPVQGGIMEAECAALLKGYFAAKRRKKEEEKTNIQKIEDA